MKHLLCCKKKKSYSSRQLQWVQCAFETTLARHSPATAQAVCVSYLWVSGNERIKERWHLASRDEGLSTDQGPWEMQMWLLKAEFQQWSRRSRGGRGSGYQIGLEGNRWEWMGSYERTAKRMGRYGNSTYRVRKVWTLFLFIVGMYLGPQQLLIYSLKQRKHSASVCEGVLSTRQGEATRAQGFKPFHKAPRWPMRSYVLFCGCSSSTQGHRGGWSQSRLSLGEGWAAAWTSRQFIARLHRKTNSYSHWRKSVGNLERPGCVRFLC